MRCFALHSKIRGVGRLGAILGGLFNFSTDVPPVRGVLNGGKQQNKKEKQMNRKHMWDMLDVVNSVESGTLAMARAFVCIGLLSLVGIAIDGDLF